MALFVIIIGKSLTGLPGTLSSPQSCCPISIPATKTFPQSLEQKLSIP